MPVSPATVRESFPAGDRTPAVVDARGDRNGAGARKRKAALVAACIGAFALGFVGMTAFTRVTNGADGSNFDYAGWLTEANHLGNVAYRAGKRLEWDPAGLRAKNCPEADAYLRREYRRGWKLA